MIKSITFDLRNKSIVVGFIDGTNKTYTDRFVYESETGRNATDFDSLTTSAQTQTEQFNCIERSVESHMDTVAKSHSWDNRWTCVARAGYINPWQTEAIKFAQWMDACWQYTIQEQQKVIAGIRPMPTTEQAIAELPIMIW